MGPALCPALWPLVPQGGAFVVCLGRSCGSDCNPTACSFSTCTSSWFAWVPTTEDPITAGEDGVADEIWVRPVIIGSICSLGVGMNDMKWLWGGTWSIWPMLYEGDWVCMTGGVWLKSRPRSKDGGVNEKWAESKNVRGVCEGISRWEDAWAVSRRISRSETTWTVRGGNFGGGDACGGGRGSGLLTTWWDAVCWPWLWLARVELVLGRPISYNTSRFAPSISSNGSWAVIRWRRSIVLSTAEICLYSELPTI